MLFGVFVFFGISPAGLKAIMCAVFILITSPAAAHAIAKGAHMSGVTLWEKSIIDKYKQDTGHIPRGTEAGNNYNEKTQA
jgi:multicomponent Na+:H+ antiporter subunit G